MSPSATCCKFWTALGPFLDRVATREALASAIDPGEQYAVGGILRADLIMGKIAAPVGPVQTST
jgi:hypothetical protein